MTQHKRSIHTLEKDVQKAAEQLKTEMKEVVEKQNKAAVTRARKVLMAMQKDCKDLRKELQVAKDSWPAKRVSPITRAREAMTAHKHSSKS